MTVDLNYFTTRWDYLKRHRAFRKAPLQTVLRTVTWSLHCLFKVPAIVRISRWNCRFFLPPKFRRAGSTGIYITREDYEPELVVLEKFLAPGKVFVDGGANTGIYTVVAGTLVQGTGKVLAFEPGAESFSVLQRNVDLNQLGHVKLFNLALSDTEGTARLYHIENAPVSYSLGGDAASANDFEEISTTNIDSILQREGIDHVDLLKLDVEGAEENVLRGAKALLERSHPAILFETSEKATRRMGLETDGAWQFLKDLGYQFFAINPDGQLTPLTSFRLGNTIAIAGGYS